MPDPCGLTPCRCKEIWWAWNAWRIALSPADIYAVSRSDQTDPEHLRAVQAVADIGSDELIAVLVSEARKEAWREACEATQDILERAWQGGTLDRFGTVCALIDALAERGPEGKT